MKNASLFTAFSGINLHYFKPDHPKESPISCHLCPALSQEVHNRMNSSESCCMYLCPLGLCHLFIPFEKDNELMGVLLSDPMCCDQSTDNLQALVQSEQKLNSPSHCQITRLTECILQMQPGKISKCAQLLAKLFAANPYASLLDTLQDELINTIHKGNPEKAWDIINQAFETFLIKNGDHINQIKAECTRFIFMLYEIMEENSLSDQQKQLIDFSRDLAKAQTIGKLKSCMNNAAQAFINKLFHPTDFKHYVLIQKATGIINRAYKTKLTQNAVANAVFLSPSYFSKLFKEALGCSFNQYLNQIRINKAKELLAIPSVNIESIHGMVGYENRSYFGKVFKNLTGITPKRYRDSILK